MNCRDIKPQLSAFLDQALPQAEQAAVAAHLQSCAACRQELDSLRQVIEAMQTLPAPGTPDLLPGVRRKLSAQPAWRRLLQGVAWPSLGLPAPAIALATSLLLVVIAVRVVPWRQELEDRQLPASGPVDSIAPSKPASDIKKQDVSQVNGFRGKDAFEAEEQSTLSSNRETFQRTRRQLEDEPLPSANERAASEDDLVRQDRDEGFVDGYQAAGDKMVRKLAAAKSVGSVASLAGRLNEASAPHDANAPLGAFGTGSSALLQPARLMDLAAMLDNLLSPAEELLPWQPGMDATAWQTLDQALRRVRARYPQ